MKKNLGLNNWLFELGIDCAKGSFAQHHNWQNLIIVQHLTWNYFLNDNLEKVFNLILKLKIDIFVFIYL